MSPFCVSLTANKLLRLTQNGDIYGTSYLSLTNGTTACGIEVKTTSATTALAEILFTTATSPTPTTRIIRQESRSASAVLGVPTLHVGGASPDAPTLAVGDYHCAVSSKLSVGSYSYPTDQLYVAGNETLTGTLTCSGVKCSGALSVSGTLSGTGFDSLLSPYALTANVLPGPTGADGKSGTCLLYTSDAADE